MSKQITNLSKTESEYLYKMLDSIKERPGMYLGQCSITRLRAFLDGYMAARADLALGLTEQEKEFDRFQEWIQKRFNVTSTQGWDSIILFYSADERDALNCFFDLFEDFRQSLPAGLTHEPLLSTSSGKAIEICI